VLTVQKLLKTVQLALIKPEILRKIVVVLMDFLKSEKRLAKNVIIPVKHVKKQKTTV
jgi:hypothetical protein